MIYLPTKLVDFYMVNCGKCRQICHAWIVRVRDDHHPKDAE